MNDRDREHLKKLSDTELQELLCTIGPEMTWVVGSHNRNTTIAMLKLYFTMETAHLFSLGRSQRSPSLNDSDGRNYNGDHEQDMDESADRVAANDP